MQFPAWLPMEWEYNFLSSAGVLFSLPVRGGMRCVLPSIQKPLELFINEMPFGYMRQGSKWKQGYKAMRCLTMRMCSAFDLRCEPRPSHSFKQALLQVGSVKCQVSFGKLASGSIGVQRYIHGVLVLALNMCIKCYVSYNCAQPFGRFLPNLVWLAFVCLVSSFSWMVLSGWRPFWNEYV